MKKLITICLCVLLAAFCCSLTRANTILFDHFDGTTAGEAFGSLSFVPSLPGYGQAVNLEQTDWIKYALPSWSGYGSGTAQGSLEMLINPRQYAYNPGGWGSAMLTLQWSDVESPPSSGYIGQFYLTMEGELGWWVWNGNGDGGFEGKTAVPLNEWTHIAVSWSPEGTKLCINGIVDAFTSANIWPAMLETTYVYLNFWGRDFGYVDELRITDTYIPEPATILLFSLGGIFLRKKIK